ncbi:Zinc finger BED domain-containing protein 5-like [Oopsacas minuta]|uniref:Zinc finger BED domain-containing protein 5-like n=1 Tax=Oopsacas minuta TaxID=111878 RepID=A0AAV7JRR9_9METZ|nr:Zinc finger BED domain-containing protein 5-like [Oopsacas minuta]
MKLKNWKRKILENENICMFEGLSELYEKKDIRLDEDTQDIIIEHLAAMESESSHYFPKCGEIEFTLLRNPFIVSPQTIPDKNDRAHEELIELINDGSAKEVFERE